nr:glycosyltransferase [Butyrivibrio fibrisolvens]
MVDQNNIIDNLKKQNENLQMQIEAKENIIRKQKEKIDRLEEIEKLYNDIQNAIGWKIVSFPGKIYEKVFSRKSLPRKIISTVVMYVKALNINNIKFVLSALKKGGIKQVKRELKDFERRSDSYQFGTITDLFLYDINEKKAFGEYEKLSFPLYDTPVVSIIIPVYNQFAYTYNCLKSVLDNSWEVPYEIIIADDVSTDDTTRLSEISENINIVRNSENQRFLKNCNNAAKHAKGKYILFLNNDTQVQHGWLKSLVDLIERDDRIGMVGSKLIYPDGSLQEAGGIIWGDGHAWNYGNGRNPLLPEFNYVKEADYISGASIMIRADLWKEIGGFDELFAPAYCEDSDLAFEVRKHGYKVVYQPKSLVVHFEGKSNGTDTSTGIKKYQVENLEKLKQKWAEEFKNQSQTEQDLFQARDRSQGKKTILVVDHYVPEYDKDAGSKTTWQYLQMFIAQGYNVKFIGDNFAKKEPYTSELEQMGVEVLYGPWYMKNYEQWILDNQENIDIIYLNRPHITEKYIDFIKNNTNIKCIYYGHDLHFLRIGREYELSGNKKLKKEAEDWKKKEFDIMHKADISYYPSQIEVDEIHKLDPSINVKAITAYVYSTFRERKNLDFAEKKDILFVGGFGHPPNEDAVYWFATEIWPKVREKLDISFHIVGSKVTPRIEKLSGSNGIILEGFVSEEKLIELYDSSKLVVVPLRYGAGVKGKVIEAIYYGTPIVTTSVGIEGIPDVEGMIEVADDADEFANKIISLYNDNALLLKTSESYCRYIQDHHSVEAVWNIIKEDFNNGYN